MQLEFTFGIYRDAARREELRRYTAMIGTETNISEEIDVDATSRHHARQIAEAAIARDYEGGVIVIDIVGPRTGLYV